MGVTTPTAKGMTAPHPAHPAHSSHPGSAAKVEGESTHVESAHATHSPHTGPPASERVPAARPTLAVLFGGFFAKGVVVAAAICVREHLEGLGDLCELSGGFFALVLRDTVGVVLHGLRAEGLFDLRLRSVTLNAEKLVETRVIREDHACTRVVRLCVGLGGGEGGERVVSGRGGFQVGWGAQTSGETSGCTGRGSPFLSTVKIR